MAILNYNRPVAGWINSNVSQLAMFFVEAEINGTSITSTDPASGVTVAHAGTAGDYTVTFDEGSRPYKVLTAQVMIEEDLPLESAKWTGYTPSTGVGTVTFYDGATEVATNFIGTAKIIMWVSFSAI